MDTQRKITEGSDQVYDTNYYVPLQEPIVASTANKVKLIVNKLHVNKHIDETTFKWLNNSQNPPRIPEFYMLTKIHKPNLAGRPMVSGNSGPTERISSFIDSLLQPIAKKQESYINPFMQPAYHYRSSAIDDVKSVSGINKGIRNLTNKVLS